MITVADVETTGDNAESDQICELGLVYLRSVAGFPMSEFTSVLCGITVPMDPRARASHHIDPADLIGLPSATQHLRMVWRPTAAVLAAHMAEFDAGFLRVALQPVEWDLGVQLLPPLVCTYRCARHIWPDAPAYGLQVLRYWLNLNVGPLPPEQHQHRALYDALVCAALLRRELEKHSLEELMFLTHAPILLTTCRYEKHRGELWSQVPAGYLEWILRKGLKQPGSDSGFDEDTIYTVSHWLAVHDGRKREEEQQRAERSAAAAEAHRVALAAQAAQHDVEAQVRQEDTGDVDRSQV